MPRLRRRSRDLLQYEDEIMPASRLGEFIRRLKALEEKMTDHLVESGGIKTQLRVNTWLTGVILVALLTRFVTDWFKR